MFDHVSAVEKQVLPVFVMFSAFIWCVLQKTPILRQVIPTRITC